MQLDALVGDIRYACRILRRTPLFTITAVLTLAVVIGANTAVLSLADQMLVRALPYPDPDRLAVAEWHRQSPRGHSQDTSIDGAMWEAVRDTVPSAEVALYSGGLGRGVNLVVDGAATFVRQQRITSNYFHVLGARPFLGREFTAQEDSAGGPAVVMMSYRLWQHGFRGGPVLGRKILLKGEPYEVVGVMPERFRSLADADVWTPLRPSRRGEGSGTNFEPVLRLRPGKTWAAVTAEMARFDRATFASIGLRPDASVWMTVKPLRDMLVATEREPLVMLSAAVGVVLLIACVNLAALLVARGSARAREIATRMALGSSRWLVIRQLMVESLVIGVCGGALGLLVGMATLDALKALGATTFEDWTTATIDVRTSMMTAGLSLLTSTVFGLVPALQASRIDVQRVLVEGGSRSIAGGSRHWARRFVVGAELALTVMLLIGAGLLIRTFVHLRTLSPGFDSRGVFVASVSLQDARYQTAAVTNRLFAESLRQLGRAPGIDAAAVSLGVPYERMLNSGVRFVGEQRGQTTNVSYVTPGFFDALRVPLKAGRGFRDSDSADAPRVAIVNDTFARLYSSGQPVLGRQLTPEKTGAVIVGVVGDVRQSGSGFQVPGSSGPLVNTPIMYVPAAQASDGFLQVVHTWFRPVWIVRGPNAAVASGAVRSAIAAIDPLLPVSEIQTMDDMAVTAIAQQRLLMILLTTVAGAALLLALIGIHGLIAQTVLERTREFGIRLALGASPGQTLWRVTRSGVVLAIAGIAAGGLLSIPATNLIASFLVGVAERDTRTYVAVGALLCVVATISTVVPALRILRLDPARTLRDS